MPPPGAITCDADAWERFPHHRSWFNRLDLALRLGHKAGPCGTAPTVSGDYIVRPIYNLSGMGVGAKRVRITAGDYGAVPPGYFWCEAFEGPQLSIDLTWSNGSAPTGWRPRNVWQGTVDPYDLTHFREWRRVPPSHVVEHVPLPPWLNEMQDVGSINVETVGGRVIEVHLRHGTEPDDTDLLIPVYSDGYPPKPAPGFVWIPDYDDADGHMRAPRLGFLKRVERFE